MAIASDGEFYTVTEAARALHVSRTTIWRLIDDGTLPAYRIGGRTIRIAADEIRRLLRPARGRPTDSTTDIFANYDAEKVRKAFRKLRGLLVGVDTEKLKREIREARGQDSQGRPAD